jgi:hypothetical protein
MGVGASRVERRNCPNPKNTLTIEIIDNPSEKVGNVTKRVIAEKDLVVTIKDHDSLDEKRARLNVLFSHARRLLRYAKKNNMIYPILRVCVTIGKDYVFSDHSLFVNGMTPRVRGMEALIIFIRVKTPEREYRRSNYTELKCSLLRPLLSICVRAGFAAAAVESGNCSIMKGVLDIVTDADDDDGTLNYIGEQPDDDDHTIFICEEDDDEDEDYDEDEDDDDGDDDDE